MLLKKPLNGYFRQRNRSGDDTSKIGKATMLEIKAMIATFSVKFENVSPAWCTCKNFVLVKLFSTFRRRCGALSSLLAITLQCKIINFITRYYFAWKPDGWKNNEQRKKCRQMPIQRLYKVILDLTTGMSYTCHSTL